MPGRTKYSVWKMQNNFVGPSNASAELCRNQEGFSSPSLLLFLFSSSACLNTVFKVL